MSELAIHIGITDDARADIAQGLSRLLADTYTLYLITHNYHCNVTGPMFNTLHLMFEGQYTEMATAVDEIAERGASLLDRFGKDLADGINESSQAWATDPAGGGALARPARCAPHGQTRNPRPRPSAP